MQFGILGALEVVADDGGAVVPSGAKGRALLAILLLHANEPVSAERLAIALWGEDAPAGSIKAVQVHVSRLRKALGDGEIVETTPAGYRLRVLPGELDATRFDELVENGRRALGGGEPERAAALLREALGLWRGPALSDLAHESFAASDIRRLEEQRLAATELALDGDLAAGRHREVVGEIEALVADHPLRERLHAQRMLALYRCGRQADALEAFRDARRLLVDEVGVEPGAGLRGLHESILRQEASLELEPSELPAELDTGSAPAVVGRDQELAWLRAHWERARAGAGGLVAVIGVYGMGKTRLAAALATEAHGQGASVLYAAGWQRLDAILAAIRRAGDAARPTLLVVDDADASAGAVAALGELARELSARPVLVLATVAGGEGLATDAALALEPLDADAVRRIALTYAPGHAAADVPADELLAASDGLPRQVHEVASEWARREAARRVVAVAPRAAAGRSDLRSAEAEVADGVLDLQAAHENADLLAEPDAPVVCPFKGLASFDVADAKFFFGRERLVAELVARAVGAPLLGVVGPSGSGKSSVVRAGLLPALASGVLPGSDEWTQVLIRPGDHPSLELRNAMVDTRPDQGVVLAVDQFEEVFTACRDEPERTAFIDALVHAARRRRGGGIVVLAVRADFYGRCATHPTLSKLLGAGHVLVGPMQRDELRRAIELPARRAGLHVEPALVDALVADVDDEPGALPLLSAALLELWQQRDGRRLRHATYERTGGVRGAVARLAEEAYGGLEPAQQRVACSLLLRLAGEGTGGAVVRRRVPLAELEGHGHEDLERVLDVLTDRRLLTMSATTVEVAHEALLREWPRLRGWLDEDAQGRTVHRHLADAAREWNERGRDSGDLYRGARLATALEWRADHEHELNPNERAFLDAGRAAGSRAHRRLRLVLAGVAALLVVAVLVGVIALHQRSTARSEARAAQAQRLGIQALNEPNLDRSLLLARQGLALDDSAATRSNLLAALLRAPAAIAVIRGDGNPLGAIDLGSDGRTLAVGDNQGNLLFLDTVTRRRVGRPYKPGGFIAAVRSSPDGTRVAVAGSNHQHGYLHLLDGRTHRIIGRLLAGQTVATVVFSPDSRALLADFAPDRGRVRDYVQRWDARTGRPLGRRRLIAAGPGPALAGFIAGGRRLVTSDLLDRATVVRDAATLRPLRSFRAGGTPSVVSPDGRIAALGSPDGSVRLLDLRTGAVRPVAGRHEAAVSGMRFTPDSRTLLTAGGDGRLIVWDVKRATSIETLEGHASGVSQVAIAPDGRTAYSTGQDGVIAWDLAGTRRLGRPFRAGPPYATGLPVATPDGARFAVPEGTGYVDIFDSRTLTRTGRISVRRLRPGASVAIGVAIAPDGRTLAATTGAGHLGLWDLGTSRPIGRELAQATVATALTVSGDGRWLATGDADGAVRLWNLHRRALVEKRVLNRRRVDDVSLSPDGTKLAATTEDEAGHGELDVLSVPRLARLIRVRVPAGDWGQFSRDGHLLLYGDYAGRAWLFDTHTWRPRGSPLTGHAGTVRTVNLSPDGHMLATTSTDATTRVWDLPSRRPIGSALTGTADHAVGSTFVAGGTRLVVIYGDGRGYLWDLRPRSWAQRACDIAGRTLTRAEWHDALPERGYAPACTPH